MKLEPTLAKASRETFWAQAYGNEDRSSNSVHDGKARGGETDRWERKTGVRGVCAAERDLSARCSQLRISYTLAHTKHLTPVISSLSGPDGYYFR